MKHGQCENCVRLAAERDDALAKGAALFYMIPEDVAAEIKMGDVQQKWKQLLASVAQALGEPVAWLDIRTAELGWQNRIVATNPQYVQNNGPENFVALYASSVSSTAHSAPHADVRAAPREEIAKIIYDAFPFTGTVSHAVKPQWLPGGNSIRQDDARRAADRILALARPQEGAEVTGTDRAPTENTGD